MSSSGVRWRRRLCCNTSRAQKTPNLNDTYLLQPAGCATPGSGIFVEQAQVRGVNSAGMICSAYDLGWADGSDGEPAFVPKTAALGSPFPDEPFPVRQL